jgi:CheY-like chemotaxis protein
MAKPVLLTVDDDREVLRAIERDLRRKYGSDYRVLRAGSGQEALDIVRELKIRNNSIALFLIDQRMPGMSGVEFLAHAIELFPDAKRVLLTAYADTDAAIAAINEPASIIICSNRGIRRKKISIPCSTSCSRIGRRRSRRSLKASACWGIAGRLLRTTSRISSRVITSRISGLISKPPLQMPRSAAWSSCWTRKRRAVYR